jgi:CheY-like chemotaxis protein
MPSRTALYVGDEPGVVEPIRDLLRERSGIGLAVVRSGSEATEAVREGEVDCVIVEYDLPDGTGVELLEELRTIAPDLGCILYADPRRLCQEFPRDEIVEFVPTTSLSGPHRLAQLAAAAIEGRTQRSYPVPADEDDRLAALERYTVDDSRLVAALERIAELATIQFAAESGFVNLVADHTVTSTVAYGADRDTYDRSTTMCTYTILEDEPTVVEDTLWDRRTTDQTVEGDEAVRFYAGTPLLSPDGYPIGTLCVIDLEPQTCSQCDRRALTLLAEEAIAWIEQYGRRESNGSSHLPMGELR